MKCRYTRHALLRMGERAVNKEMVQKAVDYYDEKWLSNKNRKCEIFALDELRVVRDKNNGVIVTVYTFGEENW